MLGLAIGFAGAGVVEAEMEFLDVGVRPEFWCSASAGPSSTMRPFSIT
jgi:hypothetical protein